MAFWKKFQHRLSGGSNVMSNNYQTYIQPEEESYSGLFLK